ncbi:cupin domain-containing protein [uncultured Acetobacteroides sp.]|uniref:cupin domain-containing protein n=1 Tax=uncultured Acetobacteroides sp. TaxID=1760811 RepID=UPI0029F5754B|nr:cupin domain-containing protein [uncultured Acetobacteroides sp.]
MKELIVKGYSTAEGQKRTDGGNSFTIKPIIPHGTANKCNASFIEVEPGNYAFGYHYHEVNEEVFYIISGTGIVRTVKGDVTVKAGEAIAFPTGEEGAHVIRNGSDTEKLVYVDFGSASLPEIVHFPDTDKVLVVGPYSNGFYDKK